MCVYHTAFSPVTLIMKLIFQTTCHFRRLYVRLPQYNYDSERSTSLVDLLAPPVNIGSSTKKEVVNAILTRGPFQLPYQSYTFLFATIFPISFGQFT